MFAIIRSDRLCELENNLRLTKADARSYEDLYKIYSKLYSDLQKSIKEKEAVMNNDIKFTNFKMSAGNWFEIARRSTGQFYQCEGFKTEEDALTKARELAKKYTDEEFLIIAPIRVVRADIPIVEEEFVAQAKIISDTVNEERTF